MRVVLMYNMQIYSKITYKINNDIPIYLHGCPCVRACVRVGACVRGFADIFFFSFNSFYSDIIIWVNDHL